MHFGSKQFKALINTPCLKANEMMQNNVGIADWEAATVSAL